MLAESLLKLRRTQTLNSLLYAQEVMINLKKIPSLKPHSGTLKISMVTPTIPDSDDQEEKTVQPQKKTSGRWYQNISSKVKHNK